MNKDVVEEDENTETVAVETIEDSVEVETECVEVSDWTLFLRGCKY